MSGNLSSGNVAGFGNRTESVVVSAIEGLAVHGSITMKALMSGDEMLLLELTYGAGAGSPLHRHDPRRFLGTGSALSHIPQN